MLKNLKGTIAIAAFALAVMALPTVASAQWRDRDRDDDYYGRGNYNRNIRGTLENLKNRARNFERTTDRIEDRRNDRRDDRDDRWGRRDRNDRNDRWGRRDRNDRNDRWGGRDRNDRWGGNWGGRNGNVSRLEDLADRFRRATDDLRDEYGNGRNLNGSRDEARRVLDLGREIEQEMRSVRVSRQAQNEWNRIRQDLNVVAQVYGYGYNNRGNYPRNRGGFPWPF